MRINHLENLTYQRGLLKIIGKNYQDKIQQQKQQYEIQNHFRW